MSSATKKMITLKSYDSKTFEVSEAVALESHTIKHMIEENCADNVITIPNVNTKILAKVIEYGKKHVEAAAKASSDDLNCWDADFVKVDNAMLLESASSNDLEVQKNVEAGWDAAVSLDDLKAWDAVADMIKGKTPEEIRKTFNSQNNFSPKPNEEEAARPGENPWNQ